MRLKDKGASKSGSNKLENRTRDQTKLSQKSRRLR